MNQLFFTKLKAKGLALSLLLMLSACDGLPEPKGKRNSDIQKEMNKIINTAKIINQLGEIDGQPDSLEPLSVEQCYGEQYKESDVRDLLDKIYDENLPISGMGLFLGVDKESQAIKNKEFRYTFYPSSNNVAESEIFYNILNFLGILVSPLGFNGYDFKIEDEYKKDINSVFDMPTIFVQSAGLTEDDIANFRPHYKPYLSALEGGEEEAQNAIDEIKSDVVKKINDYSGKKRVYSMSRPYILTLDFSTERFRYKQVNKEKTLGVNLYGYYGYKINGEENIGSDDFQEFGLNFARWYYFLSLGGYGLIDHHSEVGIKSVLVYSNRERYLVEGYIEPSAFDKSLFLAFYQRIKPINMAKSVLIDSVVSVLSPCLGN